MKVTKLIINGEEQNLTGVPYTAGSGINIDSNNEISNTLPGAIVSATVPSSPTEGMMWYDTTNDALKTYDGTNWNIVGDDAADINTKTFFISGTVEEKKSKLGQAIQYYLDGKNPILSLGNTTYTLRDVVVGDFELGTNDVYTFSSTIKSENGKFWEIVVDVLVTAQGHGSTVSSFTDTKHSAGAVVSGAAPSNPAQGDMWYDTTNDVLKIYDGTNWNITGKEYEAGDGIEIKNGPDYSAMQGPAPDGFHVPLNTEWQAVHNIWTALGGLGYDGTNFGIALKLPFAGFRISWSAVVDGQGSYGYYWSSSRNDASNAYDLVFYSSAIGPQDARYRASGFSVRCFKDSPVVPTSSWTKLYGTSIEAGGIFWSSTDGLISLSSDGNTWVTIADKNLGATTVWNSGDTLSESNCGGYFQWGNNYMFPFTGSVTTSGTQVDASNYGPGNYYNSSTFITRSDSPYRWDTTDNGNLWGGETGVVTLENAITNTGVLVSDQPNNILTSGMKIWAGTETNYGNLSSYDSNTLYLTVE